MRKVADMRFWLPLLLAAFGGILSVLTGRATYAAQSVVVVGAESPAGVRQAPSASATKNAVTVMNGAAFAMRVVKRLALAEDAAFLAAAGRFDAGGGKMSSASAAASLSGEGGLVRALESDEKGGVVIEVISPDPALSVRIANAYAEEYAESLPLIVGPDARAAQLLLRQEADRMEQRIRSAESRLRGDQPGPGEQGAGEPVAERKARVDAMRQRLAGLELTMRQLDNDLAAVAAARGSAEALLGLSAVVADPRMIALEKKAQTEMPGMSAVDTQLLRAEKSALALEIVGELEGRRAQAEADSEGLRQQVDAGQRELLAAAADTAESERIAARLAADRARLKELVARLDSAQHPAVSARVVQRAGEARVVPVRIWLRGLVGAAGGYLLGLALVLAAGYLAPPGAGEA